MVIKKNKRLLFWGIVILTVLTAVSAVVILNSRYYQVTYEDILSSNSEKIQSTNALQAYTLSFDGTQYIGDYQSSYIPSYCDQTVDCYNFEGGYFEIFRNTRSLYRINFDRELRYASFYAPNENDRLKEDKALTQKCKEISNRILSQYVDLSEYTYYEGAFWTPGYQADVPISFFQFYYYRSIDGFITNDVAIARFNLDGELMLVTVKKLFTENELALNLDKTKLERTVKKELENKCGAVTESISYEEPEIYKLTDGRIVFRCNRVKLEFNDGGYKRYDICSLGCGVILKK